MWKRRKKIGFRCSKSIKYDFFTRPVTQVSQKFLSIEINYDCSLLFVKKTILKLIIFVQTSLNCTLHPLLYTQQQALGATFRTYIFFAFSVITFFAQETQLDKGPFRISRKILYEKDYSFALS